MNRISSWSIRHPVPTVVLFLSLLMAGVFGFMQLRTNNMPDIDLPTVTVTVSQNGASPTELETQVTKTVEGAVAGLGDIDSISSTVNEGSSTTTIEFELGTDVDRATNDVRNAVSGIEDDLPDAAGTPVVERSNSTGNAIITYVVSAPDMAPDKLSWYVDNDIGRAMLSVSGVAKVQRSGGVERAVRVELDPQRLSGRGITAAEVSDALAAENVNMPGGRTTVGAQEQSVRTLGSSPSVDDLADIRIALADGKSVRLGDLGTISDTWEEPRQRARLDGQEVVAFSVFRSVGSSEVDVTTAVRAAVSEIATSQSDVTFQEITSSSDFVVESYDAAVEALWLGALLAIGVVWLFLRDLRATLVAAVAMPLSLIPTFAVLAWFDISLNSITLLALSLVVGLLVDDAIVEIENIVRHMRQSGKRAYDAAIEAADEIGLAVVATTLTIVAVFLPVAFMSGIPGKFFMDFAIAACVSVVFSLIVARMLTPLMGAFLVKASGREIDDTPFWVPTYLAILGWAMRHRVITLIAGVVFFVASLGLATQLSTEFMPATDRGESQLSVSLPPGSTLAETDAVVQAITERLKDDPAVALIFATEGTSVSSGVGPQTTSASEVRTAKVTFKLVPRSERSISEQEFEAEASQKLADIPGARMQFGAGGFSGAKISVTLAGNDPAKLDAASASLLSEMREVPGLQNPVSSNASAKPELVITPDPARTAEAGISATTIANTISVATLGDTESRLAKFNLGDRQVSILVTLTADAMGDPDQIGLLQIKGTHATVPLASVAKISFGSGPTTIERFDRERSVTIDAELSGITLGDASSRIAALPTMQNLPDGVSERKQGDSARLAELVSGFVIAIATGILLMYATLVLLFGGFIHPITILVALPLAIGGALGLLLLTGHALAISAFIGLLMLMGIAAKNSILLIEYALVAIKNGVERQTALLDAARKRARPIVMTSIAMGVGMLPIALGFGADAESRAPMAIAVIGGLVSSTLLSLVYVPVFFTFMDDLQRFLGRWLSRLLVEQKPAGGDVPAVPAE